MATASRLCDTCAAIPFDAEDPPFGNKNCHTTPLGRLDQIRKKTNCPLCRIVIFAVFEQQRGWEMYFNPDQEVRLTVGGGRGPPGAFYIGGVRGIGSWICIVNESTHHTSTSEVRCFLPNSEPRLDLERARRWMSVCENSHGNKCNPIWHETSPPRYIIPGLEVLRLIDVVNGSLVELQNPCRYLALSYVWGGAPNFRLTTINKSTLMQNGIIRSIWSLLPKTIQDAIDLVKALKERFLWIDALCLMQNDPLDMQKGIDVMDLIYERAIMTIVAATGDNANAGLPGVREGNRFITQYVEQIIPGIKLAVYNDLDNLLRPSTYSRRAWTFQEQLLSRRALFFIDNQVYFRCRECTWSENCVDQFSTPNNDRVSASMLQNVWHMDSPGYDYRLMLFYYTKRALTNQADVLYAMTGIIKRISSKMKCRFFEGMATAALDTFMIFRAYRSLLRRRHGFPSYSWTGWIGGLGIDFDASVDELHENDWLFRRTWIIWYKRSASGSVNLVWDILANESFPTTEMGFIGYRQRSPFGNRHSLGFPTSRTTPTESLHFELAIPQYPLLQFWTLAVYYNISGFEVFKAEAYILDNQQTKCGSMYMDGYEDSTFFEIKGPLEFIVLSEADWDLHSLSLDNCEYPVDSGLDAWKYYHVLLLEWSGGIAERRGIGVIFQKAVERSFPPGPIWKEISMA